MSIVFVCESFVCAFCLCSDHLSCDAHLEPRTYTQESHISETFTFLLWQTGVYKADMQKPFQSRSICVKCAFLFIFFYWLNSVQLSATLLHILQTENCSPLSVYFVLFLKWEYHTPIRKIITNGEENSLCLICWLGGCRFNWIAVYVMRARAVCCNSSFSHSTMFNEIDTRPPLTG